MGIGAVGNGALGMIRCPMSGAMRRGPCAMPLMSSPGELKGPPRHPGRGAEIATVSTTGTPPELLLDCSKGNIGNISAVRFKNNWFKILKLEYLRVIALLCGSAIEVRDICRHTACAQG